MELTLNDATVPLLAGKPSLIEEPPKPPTPSKNVVFMKNNPGVSITRVDIDKAKLNIPKAVTNVVVANPTANQEVHYRYIIIIL